jgi:hypothetical protein
MARRMTQLRSFDRRLLPALTLAVAVVACDQGAPKTERDRDVIASATPPASAPRSNHPLDAGALDAAPVYARAPDGGTRPGVTQGPDFELLRNTFDGESCIKLVVGTTSEQAELCTDFRGGYWIATHQVVRVVRAGKKVTVLDVLTRVEGIDTGATMLETRLRITADGMSATVDAVAAKPNAPQPTPGNPVEDCKSPPPNPKDDKVERANYGRPTYGELRRRICDELGTYVWDGERFTRASVK